MENKEALVQKVYDCTEREHSAFIAEMKTHDADFIVEHAYEIVIMDDLRMIFEENDLSLPVLKELDKVDKPLASIYDEWLKNDGEHMGPLRDTVGVFAETRMLDTAEASALWWCTPDTSVERLTSSQTLNGSIPSVSTKKQPKTKVIRLFFIFLIKIFGGSCLSGCVIILHFNLPRIVQTLRPLLTGKTAQECAH